MKKIILIFVLLLLPLIMSIEVDMKTEFSQGETLMAKISGNFLENIEKENVLFYREHVRVPMLYDLAKINGEYYVYAQLGDKEPNNYSLRIEDIQYMQGTIVKDEEIVTDFIITNETADFSINPGFIISDEPFEISVQNLRDFKIEIDIEENKTETNGGGLFESLFGGVDGTDYSIELSSGEIENLQFDLGEETSFSILELSTENITYEIPVYIFVVEKLETTEEEETEETTEEEETEETTEEEEIKIASTKICSEMGGVVCAKKEKCNGTTEYAKDAVCCIGNCEVIKKSNTGKILGWTMVIIILVFVIWFFKTKYKGAKKEINLLKIASGKK